MVRRLLLALLLTALGAVSPANDDVHVLAERAREKIDSIIVLGETERLPETAETHTVLTDAEVDAYLLVHGPELLPDSIAGPEIRLGDGGRIRARAIIDLRAVRLSRPRAWHDPLSYVNGSVEVVAAGRMITREGLGRAQLDTATVGGVTVPKVVVQELLRFYTATPDNPGGFNLDEPFELPVGIRHVVLERGRATIVQ